MKTGMQKCSFFDDATGTVVQLNSISEEGEIKIKEPLASKDADGGERFAGHHSRIEVTGYDDTGYDQLKTWMDNETPLKFVSYGLEGHILWYRETIITVKKNMFVPPGKNNSFTIVMEQKGGDHSGFDGSQIWYGKNLLYGSAGWADSNGDGVADGYAAEGWLHTFVGGNQRISSTDPSTLCNTNHIILYPLAGAQLSLFVNPSNYVGDLRSRVDEVDSSGAAITIQHDYLPNAIMMITNVACYRLRASLLYANPQSGEVGATLRLPFMGFAGEYREVAY